KRPARLTGNSPRSIASGDPRPESIMLWTRVVPAGADDVDSCDASDFAIRLRITDANHDAGLGSNAALRGRTVLDTTIAVRAEFAIPCATASAAWRPPPCTTTSSLP